MLEHLLQSILQQMQQPREDLEKNVRALLSETITRMDLVSHEELARQEALLYEARQTIRALSSQIEQLQQRVDALP
jgi:BMFP domain-containing protein YqiC